MSELSADAKQALRAAHESYQPSPEQLAKVQAALLVQLAAAGGGAATLSAVGHGKVTTLLGKLGGTLKLAALVLAGGTIWWMAAVPSAPGTGPSAQRSAPMAVPLATPRAAPPARNPAALSVPTPVEPGPSEPAVLAPSLHVPPGARPRARRPVPAHRLRHEPAAVSTKLVPDEPPSISTASAPPPTPAQPRTEPVAHPSKEPPRVAAPEALTLEIASITKAHRLLADARADEALQVLDHYLASSPRGMLREEALATRVLCLCALQHVDLAQRALRSLTLASPSSPHLARIRAACPRLFVRPDR